MRRKMRGMVRGALLPVLFLGGVGATWTGYQLTQQDARHARFYEMGSGINQFLKGYCKTLQAAHGSGDLSALEALYGEEFHSPQRGTWQLRQGPDEGPVAVETLQSHGTQDQGRPDVVAEWGTYLEGLREIDQTICKINLIESAEPPASAVLTVKFILDGWDLQDRRIQDRRFFRWNLVRQSEEEGLRWQILRDELVEGVRVAGDGGSFEEVDPSRLGLDFQHRRDPSLDPTEHDLAFGVIQHASGGISSSDVDGDGQVDLFLLDGVASKLFWNLGPDEEGRPRFEDRTATAGLEDLGQAHSALFLDFDNDGDQDLVVGRYLAPGRLFENQGRSEDGFVSFIDRSTDSGLDTTAPVSSLTALDFDRDGDLDLYVGAYGNAFEAIPRLPFFARNGKANRLLRNDGDLRFTDVTQGSGTGDTGWTLAVAAADVNGDGWMDLGVANDFGRKSLFLNQGDGTFEDVTRSAGVLDFSGGMGLVFADFDGDQNLDLYTSNINSNQRWFGEDLTVQQYMRNVMRTRWALTDAGEYLAVQRLLGRDWIALGQQIGEGNSLFRNRGDSLGDSLQFEELHDSATSRAGWSWTVASFDYDNDADLDLYATNGWISQTPGTDL